MYYFDKNKPQNIFFWRVVSKTLALRFMAKYTDGDMFSSETHLVCKNKI